MAETGGVGGQLTGDSLGCLLAGCSDADLREITLRECRGHISADLLQALERQQIIALLKTRVCQSGTALNVRGNDAPTATACTIISSAPAPTSHVHTVPEVKSFTESSISADSSSRLQDVVDLVERQDVVNTNLCDDVYLQQEEHEGEQQMHVDTIEPDILLSESGEEIAVDDPYELEVGISSDDDGDRLRASGTVAASAASSQEEQVTAVDPIATFDEVPERCGEDPLEVQGQLILVSGDAHKNGLCGLLQRLAAASTRKRVTGITLADLLLAFVGVHAKWTIGRCVASALCDLLNPDAALEVPDFWSLRPHQQDGYRWLIARAASRLGCILADDMGLGKTRQAIAWLLGVRAALAHDSADGTSGHLSQRLGCGASQCARPDCRAVSWTRALIVAPSMLVRGEDSVWIRELREVSKQWRMHLSVWQWHGERAQPLRTDICRGEWRGPMIELFDVVVTSYESFLVSQDQFCNETWTCVILDEAQSVKNHGTQISAATKRLSDSPFRLALTGSPVENSLDDLHSILEFVQPDVAGSRADFHRRFPSSNEGRASLKRLLQALVLRREASSRGSGCVELVPCEDLEIPVRMGPDQAAVYKLAATRNEQSSLKRMFDLELVCSHPWCYAAKAPAEVRRMLPSRFCAEDLESQQVSDSAKMMELVKVLRGVLARREKVLVFFCRRVTGTLLAALLRKEFGPTLGLVYGNTDPVEREKLMHKFKEDLKPGSEGLQILLLSVAVGAVGLNFPNARWVVHFERVWNPAVERQATCRIHRLTSPLPVKAYALYTEDSVEERKRMVLERKYELSSRIIEALDGQDLDGDADCPASPPADIGEGADDLLALISEAMPCADPLVEEGEWSDEDIGACCDSDDAGDAGDAGDAATALARNGPYPTVSQLRPREFMNPKVGKYGDPSNQALWQWYVDEGRKELHPSAADLSTAALARQTAGRQAGGGSRMPCTSRPSRVNDVQLRDDRVFEIDLGDGALCRLFVPSDAQHFFLAPDADGHLRFRHPAPGDAPFPIFIPSCGRSALDDEVGLLDLTATMVSKDGGPLRYLQVVAVKPSEVERYRASAPFFVVMELPKTKVQHSSYGDMQPEQLGIGNSRHWLLQLANSLHIRHVFMLDDSVHAWRGITLVNDPFPLFDRMPGSRAQLSIISLGMVMEHFAVPHFLEHEMANLSALGFARYSPHLFRAKAAYCRGHVYSSYILNVERVVQQQGISFDPQLFIWEDLDFNRRAHDVCKCVRFCMLKRVYRRGGCTEWVAHSENPLKRVKMLPRLSPDHIVQEALCRASGSELEGGGEGSCKTDASLPTRRGRGRPSKHVKREEGCDVVPVPPIDIFEVEADPVFTVAGAICDERGMLSTKFYRTFVQAFKELEQARAIDVAAPRCDVKRPPGMRRDDSPVQGLSTWDDTANGRKSSSGRWGAGWKASHTQPELEDAPKSVWFNIRMWGSWRFAFVLARLQRQVWMARFPQQDPDKVPETPARSRKTSRSRLFAMTGSSNRKRGRPSFCELATSRTKAGKTKAAQATLKTFFSAAEVKEELSDKKTLNLQSFGFCRRGEVKLL